MRRRVGKALYVFLCMIMGMVLFAIFHRAVVVIYYILLNSNFNTYSFGLAESTLRAIDFFSLLVALFFGGWYGTALGLHWYKLVYEDRDSTGLFHGFVPHHWRDRSKTKTDDFVAVSSKPSRPAKIVHHSQSSRSNSFDIFKTIKPTEAKSPMNWDLDDLTVNEDKETPKRKPRATKPRARKTVTKTRRKVSLES